MKYSSCERVEGFFLNISGRIDTDENTPPPLGFCCEPLENIPAIPIGEDARETLSQIMDIREHIIVENKKVSLGLAAERTYSAVCSKCAYCQENRWRTDGAIHYVNLSMYPALCQCKCIYCNIPTEDMKKSMNSPEVKKAYDNLFGLLEYAKAHGMVAENAMWQVSSGEITIHPYKDRIMEIVEGQAAMFYTNCFIYDEKIAEMLHKNPNSSINLSIDAGLPQTWHKVKGVDNFETVMMNLASYYAASARPGQITLKYIILPGINDTYEDFQSVIEIMKTVQCSQLSISRDDTKKYNSIQEESDKLIGAAGYLVAMCHKNQIRNILTMFTPQEQQRVIHFAEELLRTGQICSLIK
jgi:wyosine [tRNA(Phe)-imidazoG37] synthetase (radical SAM superfamily)